jgi:hypothetical protein
VDAHAEHAGHAKGRPTVSLTVSQQKYLPAGAREQEMHAILTVRVDGAGGAGPGPALAEVLVIDCSSSMDRPEEKFRAAKNAAVAALRMLPDGTPFAVVQGTHTAETAYPATGSMPRATAALRSDAERAVHRLLAAGGTSVGTWLDLSRRLLAAQSAPIGHVLLLTDGRNEHDDQLPLAGVLDVCDGQFVCDAWGIGDGWDAQELLRVTSRLHGSADAVRAESDLPGEYQKLIRGLLTKAVPELVIRVVPSPGSTVRYLKQVYPTETRLSGTGAAPDDGASEFVTRAWGDETRRYQLCLSTDPAGRPRREDLQLAVVGVDLPDGGEALLPPPQPCVVHWTDDPVLSQRTDDQVLHFRLYQELGRAVAGASDAYRHDDPDLAERHLGRAVALAHSVGARQQLAQLERLVEIHDAAAGRVRLRPDLLPVDFQHLITASSRSTYGPELDGPGAATGPGGQPDATAPCPACGEQTPASAKFCPLCGHRFEARP